MEDNGLTAPWSGFVWMNPPFTFASPFANRRREGVEPWVRKFVKHADGIALVPDRTSTGWFQMLAKASDAVLFLSPKVSFVRGDGKPSSSNTSGTALAGIGERAVEALLRARRLGVLLVPIA
jgi:hypothetical protein